MSTYQIARRVETSTLSDLLRWRSQHQPQRQAYGFVRQAEHGNESITYAELDHNARIIGTILQDKGASGKPVLLLHPPGIEYVTAFYGCLYAGAMAVPAYPPHSARTLPRIQAIAKDSQAGIALTTAETLADLKRHLTSLPQLQALDWIATDVLDESLADEWQEHKTDPSAIAFLQYTSGSTGTPRGVMVTHNNLRHNLDMIGHVSQQTPESHIVSWLPPYHDLGLICGILFPLYIGFPSTLMSPVTFLQRPFRWLEIISSLKATMSQAPNFAYELCCVKVTPEQRETLDLSNWDLAACGGEPVRKETIERFVATFGPHGFRRETFFPGYGMAETTLIFATDNKFAAPIARSFNLEALKEGRILEAPADSENSKSIVGYPQFSPDQRYLIVDPETRKTCLPDQVGELWVEGPSITMGYWHRPEETSQTFQAYTTDTNEGPFLRTGDLAFAHNGVLFITGRHKDLIIINGSNYYPQDIELTTERSHRAIRQGCCVAFSIEAETNRAEANRTGASPAPTGSEQLVVLVEIDPRYQPASTFHQAGEKSTSHRPLEPQEVTKAIRAAVQEEYGLQIQHIQLLKAGSILKTSSGKLQRRACRAEFLAKRLGAWDESNEQ